MKTPTLTILVLLLLASSIDVKSQVSLTDKFDVRTSIEKWVYFLASDEMRGRANGSPEMKVAAEFIADIYRSAGLKPGYGNEYIKPYSFTSRNRTIEERNVAAVIPGTNPALKDEYIVITAHFDHVGIGRPVDGDSIYNGADDNAAGTASIMAIASSIMSRNLKTGRTLVFVSVSGEEMGMRGSRNFVAEPTVDLKKVYVNINVEMPGYNQILGKNQFYITGESMTNIDDLIRSFKHKSDWKLNSTYANAERLFGSSDNIAFAQVVRKDTISYGVPSATFCTHAGETHIHKPSDEPQFIDYDNMTGFVNYLTDLVVWLSNSTEKVVWTNARYERY